MGACPSKQSGKLIVKPLAGNKVITPNCVQPTCFVRESSEISNNMESVDKPILDKPMPASLKECKVARETSVALKDPTRYSSRSVQPKINSFKESNNDSMNNQPQVKFLE